MLNLSTRPTNTRSIPLHVELTQSHAAVIAWVYRSRVPKSHTPSHSVITEAFCLNHELYSSIYLFLMLVFICFINRLIIICVLASTMKVQTTR